MPARRPGRRRPPCHGASQPVRPWSSRNTSVGSVAGGRVDARQARRAAPAVPAGSGAPSRPATTWSAVTRAAVTRSVLRWSLACSTPCVPDEHRDQHDRRRQRGGAPAVGRQARAREQARRAEAPQRPARARRPAARAASARAARRRSRAASPPRIANALAASPEKRSAIATPPPRQSSAGERSAATPGPGVLDRDLAQRLGRADPARPARGGDDRELGDADAHAERRDERDPGAAGREAVAARRRGRRARRRSRRPAGRRPAGRAPPATQRDDQRLAGDQPADLARRRAERAQHRGLAPALGDRERERAGDDEQRDGAGDAAHRAEDRDQGLAVGAPASPASASAACARSSTSTPAPRRAGARAARPGDVPARRRRRSR